MKKFNEALNTVNKRMVVVGIIAIIVFIVIFTLANCSGNNSDSNNKENEVALAIKNIEGIKSSYDVDINDKEYDFLKDINYDKKLLEIKVDTTKVKFDTVGSYDIEFIITDLNDEDNKESVKSKVNIVDNNKNDETTKPEETDKTETPVETEKPQVNENNNVVSKPTTNQNTTNNSSSSNVATKPKPNTQAKPTEQEKPTEQKPSAPKPQEHTHVWVDVTKTVHHDEVGHYENVLVKEAWDEPIYEEVARDICSSCGKDLTGTDIATHVKAHILNGDDKGGHHTEYIKTQTGTKHHDAVYEKKYIVDTPAYDETVVTGQKCSCGATK